MGIKLNSGAIPIIDLTQVMSSVQQRVAKTLQAEARTLVEYAFNEYSARHYVRSEKNPLTPAAFENLPQVGSTHLAGRPAVARGPSYTIRLQNSKSVKCRIPPAQIRIHRLIQKLHHPNVNSTPPPHPPAVEPVKTKTRRLG